MSSSKGSNPHDVLFRKTFSNTENAKGLLIENLPQELCNQVDWSTLKKVPGEFLDRKLREHHSDLLYSVRVGKSQTLIYVLAEHKSHPDHWVALQLLRYQVNIWQGWRKRNPKEKRLPPIIPFVLHHSKTKWKTSQRFHALFGADDDMDENLLPFLPKFEYLLQDLTAQDTQTLQNMKRMSPKDASLFYCSKRFETTQTG